MSRAAIFCWKKSCWLAAREWASWDRGRLSIIYPTFFTQIQVQYKETITASSPLDSDVTAQNTPLLSIPPPLPNNEDVVQELRAAVRAKDVRFISFFIIWPSQSTISDLEARVAELKQALDEVVAEQRRDSDAKSSYKSIISEDQLRGIEDQYEETIDSLKKQITQLSNELSQNHIANESTIKENMIEAGRNLKSQLELMEARVSASMNKEEEFEVQSSRPHLQKP